MKKKFPIQLYSAFISPLYKKIKQITHSSFEKKKNRNWSGQIGWEKL